MSNNQPSKSVSNKLGEAIELPSIIMIDAEHKPPPHPFYGDSWERGLDPWHSDAFPSAFKRAGSTGVRRSGWFLLDAWGNPISFVPDSVKGGAA